MNKTPTLAYVCTRHFTVINKDTGVRADYAPGDLIPDFSTAFDEHAQRVHMEGGYVSIAMPGTDAKPPVAGGRALANTVDAPATLVRPDKSLFSPAAPYVPVGQDKPAIAGQPTPQPAQATPSKPAVAAADKAKAAAKSRMDANAAAIAAGSAPSSKPPAIMPRASSKAAKRSPAEPTL